jgi:hypothetical protein
VDLPKKFPLVAVEPSTGSVRTVWEHVFFSAANRAKRTCRELTFPQMERRALGWFTPTE